jgi:hypothetical protein
MEPDDPEIRMEIEQLGQLQASGVHALTISPAVKRRFILKCRPGVGDRRRSLRTTGNQHETVTAASCALPGIAER